MIPSTSQTVAVVLAALVVIIAFATFFAIAHVGPRYCCRVEREEPLLPV